jgi:hypothetical protein
MPGTDFLSCAHQKIGQSTNSIHRLLTPIKIDLGRC